MKHLLSRFRLRCRNSTLAVWSDVYFNYAAYLHCGLLLTPPGSGIRSETNRVEAASFGLTELVTG
jgi:hypothetical protein